MIKPTRTMTVLKDRVEPAVQAMTREQWLTEACHHFLDTLIMPVVDTNTAYVKGLYAKPEFKISIGWMLRGGSKAIGQCFRKAASKGSVNEIFIRPDFDDSNRILDILIHELIHAVDDCESGHRGFFKATAVGVGLVGKMTATQAGEELTETIAEYVNVNGKIPHTAMTANQSPVKKQSTRMLKLECMACGFIARTTQKWLDKIQEGARCPICASDKLEVN